MGGRKVVAHSGGARSIHTGRASAQNALGAHPRCLGGSATPSPNLKLGAPHMMGAYAPATPGKAFRGRARQPPRGGYGKKVASVRGDTARRI